MWANEGWGKTSDLSTSGYTNSETNSLAASIIPTPSSTWLNAVDTCISSLKSGGVWTNLDFFYGFAAPSVDACTWNWKNTAAGRLTAVGGLVYTANTCVNSDGTTGYFTSTFAMNSGVGVNGGAHFGYFTLNESTTDDISPFQTSNGRHFLGLQSTTDGSLVPLMIGGLNTSSFWQPSCVYGSTVGHWVLQQNTTVDLELFLDGTSLGVSPTQTSAADNGTLLIFKTAANSYTTRKVSFMHYGAKLTAPQQLALSKALYTFLTTMDVRPKTGYIGLSSGPGNDAPYKRIALGDGGTFAIPVTTSNANYSGVIQGRAGSYSYGLIKVGDPNYLNLYRLETRPNDFSSTDTNITRRMMLTRIVNTIPFPSPIIDCSFSVYIESGSQWENVATTIVDGRETNNAGGAQCGPTNSLTAAGNWYTWLWVNSASNVNQPPGTVQIGSASPATSAVCSQGAWHHIRNLWKFDTGGAGFCQSWFDGVKTLDYVGSTGRGAPGAPYFHQLSMYTTASSAAASTSAIWIANYELDVTGAQPFAGRLASPLPTPTLPVATVTAPSAPTISFVRHVASQNSLFNTSSGASNTCNNLAVFGASSNPGATITLFRASSVQLGTATTDASGNWRCETGVLADAAHALTAKITVAGVTSAASSAFNVTVAPTLTSLPVSIGSNMVNNQTVRMDGHRFTLQCNVSGPANNNTCILADTHTLDMTTIPTDTWSDGTHRSEVYDQDTGDGTIVVTDGSITNVCYEYQLPVGYPINNNFNGGSQGGWCTIGQIHDSNTTGGAQGYGQECGGELGSTANGDAFVLGYIDSSHIRREPYVDTQNQVRGVWHRIDFQISFNKGAPTGIIKVWRNNIQIANVTGIQWGFQAPYYFKCGCYHGVNINQTVRVMYRNFQIRIS